MLRRPVGAEFVSPCQRGETPGRRRAARIGVGERKFRRGLPPGTCRAAQVITATVRYGCVRRPRAESERLRSTKCDVQCRESWGGVHMRWWPSSRLDRRPGSTPEGRFSDRRQSGWDTASSDGRHEGRLPGPLPFSPVSCPGRPRRTDSLWARQTKRTQGVAERGSRRTCQSFGLPWSGSKPCTPASAKRGGRPHPEPTSAAATRLSEWPEHRPRSSLRWRCKRA